MIAKNLSHAQLLCRVSTLCDPMDRTVCQIPLSMGFSRQVYWRGLPCPPPGHPSDPGRETASLVSPTLAGEFFTTESPGKPCKTS